MSYPSPVTDSPDDAAAYLVEDALTDLVEKMVTAWGDQGLHAEDEVPLLMSELREVVAASDERVRTRNVRQIARLKRGGRR